MCDMREERNNMPITFSGEQYSTGQDTTFEHNLLNQRQGVKNPCPLQKYGVGNLYESNVQIALHFFKFYGKKI